MNNFYHQGTKFFPLPNFSLRLNGETNFLAKSQISAKFSVSNKERNTHDAPRATPAYDLQGQAKNG